MSTTLEAPQVEAVVRRGWRRRLLVLAVDQLALVLALLFAGVSLLIVLGTQILAWQWLLAIAAVGLTLAVLGVRRGLAGAYRVAQMMDRHLALNDALSTAWFLRMKAPAANEPAAAFQVQQAEQLAALADPAAAFPFRRARAWILTLALGLLAVALFSARYLVTRELSLQRSFLPLAITEVFENIRHGGSKPDRNERIEDGRMAKSLPAAAVGPDAERREQSAKSEQGQKPSQQSGDAANVRSDQAPNLNSDQAKGADGKGGDQKRDGAGDGLKNGSNAEANKQANNSGDKQDSKDQEANGGQRSSSMMDRLRDAVSSVMAKIKPSGAPQNSQGSQKNADGQKGANQPDNKEQNGEGQKDSGKEQSAQEQSSGEQQGQGSAKAQASQGKDSAQPSDKKGSDAQSGVGHSNGDKDVRAAEQAKAMGKLAEIIGKRSASLTGDMQIEPSGKQRLQTNYTHEVGQHSDLGGEINRDEIPVEDQEYVREYMERVRKKPAKDATKNSQGR